MNMLQNNPNYDNTVGVNVTGKRPSVFIFQSSEMEQLWHTHKKNQIKNNNTELFREYVMMFQM